MKVESGTLIAKRFRLDALLGEGGMGSVWSATHTVTRRRHAIKLLKAPSATLQQRFVREARAASSVDHPHVMRIEDVFELDDGMPVLVLELLEGEPLSEKLARDGRLTVKDAAQILLPIVSAVGAAHEAGIVHRDLKPDNIFMSTAGVKVLDFGIAKVDLGAELAAAGGGLTQTGALIGTPFYMSPEQASGERVDHRTDIWSLGIIAYQMLTGVLPTQADTVGAALKIVMTARIAPVVEHVDDLDEAMAKLVTSMLSLEPTDRPRDLREVMSALTTFCDDEVPTFGPPSGGAIAAPVADANMETGEWLAERAASDHGEAPATAPSEEASKPDTKPLAKTPRAEDTSPVVDDAKEKAALSPPAPNGSTTASSAAVLTARPVADKKRPWLGLTVIGVGAAAAVALLFMTREREAPPPPVVSQPAVQEPAVAVPVEALRQPKLGLEAIETYRAQAKRKGAVLSSASWWETVARDFEIAAKQPDAPVRWKAAHHFARGHVFIRRGNPKDAVEAFQEAVGLDPEWAEPQAGLSSALLGDGQLEAAYKAAQEAQRLDPKWWRGVVCGARVLNKQKRINEAIQEYRRALTLAPESALVLAEIALTYHAARLDTEADRHGRMALELDPDVSAVRLMFAERALERNNGKEAIDHATRAVAISPRDIGARLALGDALVLTGQREEALAAYKSMLELLDGRKAPPGVPQQRVALVAKMVPSGLLPPPRVSGAKRTVTPRSAKSKMIPVSPQPEKPDRSSAPSVEESYF